MNVAATRPHCSLNVEPSTESITTSEVNTSNDKNENEEWQKTLFANAYRDFFTKTMCPSTAYRYDHGLDHNSKHSVIRRHDDQNANNDYNNEDYRPPTLLVGTVVANQRITSPDWERQDTRHVRIRIRASDNCPLSPSTAKKNGAGDGTDPKRANAPFVGDATSVTISATTTHQHLPYRAGDIATIIPQNTNDEVSALLQVLPESIQALVDAVLTIQPNNNNLIWPPPVLWHTFNYGWAPWWDGPFWCYFGIPGMPPQTAHHRGTFCIHHPFTCSRCYGHSGGDVMSCWNDHRHRQYHH